MRSFYKTTLFFLLIPATMSLALASGGGGGLGPSLTGSLGYAVTSNTKTGASGIVQSGTPNLDLYYGVTSTASPTQPTSTYVLGLNWQVGLAWSAASPPNSVDITYQIDDYAFVSWTIAGYDPADPNGYVTGNATADGVDAWDTIYQATSSQADEITNDTGFFQPPVATVDESSNWQMSGSGWVTKAMTTFSFATLATYAGYNKPAHNSASDLQYAYGLAQCDAISFVVH